MVWLGNERNQDLLDAYAISDLIPSFKEQGQQVPAFGRDISGIVEVADGSRRRFAALETMRPFYVWVGELSNEQMQYLSEIGNQYNPTSAYEKGKRYAAMLNTLTQEQVAETVKVSRKAIMRCVQTASLPIEIINCFQSPNEISARQGELFFKGYKSLSEEQQLELVDFCVNWLIPEKGTGKYDKDGLVTLISSKIFTAKPKQEQVQPRELAMGASVVVKGGNAIINIPKVSEISLNQIERAISRILEDEALNNF
jgi:ParB family chromosome partitioning protein